MIQFIEIVGDDSNPAIWVNPQQIVYITTTGSDDKAKIILPNGREVTLTHSVEQLLSMLGSASK